MIATPTTTAPTTNTMNTNRMSSGYHFVCGAIPNGMRIAEADTVIIVPERMQNRNALSTL